MAVTVRMWREEEASCAAHGLSLTILEISTKKREILFEPSVPFLSSVFTAALFMRAEPWKQAARLAAEEGRQEM